MAVVAPAPYRVQARNIAPDSDNKIHDDEVAQQFGFGGALVPGVDLFAYVSHPLVEAWGLDFLSGGRLDVRFRRPVYDGETVVATAEAQPDSTYAVALSGADGDVRTVGSADRAPDGSTREIPSFLPAPLPVPRLSISGALPSGPLGSVDEPVDLARHEAYLDAIDEPLDLYRTEQVAHPGALLRIVNELLMRNVELGPWIHTASNCRFLAPAPLPGVLHADGTVTDCYDRSGHGWVEYDALVRCDGTPVLAVHHTAIYRVASPP